MPAPETVISCVVNVIFIGGEYEHPTVIELARPTDSYCASRKLRLLSGSEMWREMWREFGCFAELGWFRNIECLHFTGVAQVSLSSLRSDHPHPCPFQFGYGAALAQAGFCLMA